MKATELRKLSTEELVQKEMTLKKDLFDLRFQLATGQLVDTTKINACKRDIARVKTLLTERATNA